MISDITLTGYNNGTVLVSIQKLAHAFIFISQMHAKPVSILYTQVTSGFKCKDLYWENISNVLIGNFGIRIRNVETTFSSRVGQLIIGLILRYFKRKIPNYIFFKWPSIIRYWPWCPAHLIFRLMDKISQQASSMMFVKHCHDLCPLSHHLSETYTYSPSYIIKIYTSFPW